ncbi:MAG: V-type ATP synthase subunit E [Nitrososphaeria archaeon]
MSTAKNVESLIETIRKMYDEEKQEIIRDANNYKESIIETYRKKGESEGEKIAKEIVEKAKQKAILIIQKEVSEAQLKSDWMILEKKEEIFKGFIEKVLVEFYKPDFLDKTKELLYNLIVKGVLSLNVDKCAIVANEKTLSIMDTKALGKKLKDLGLKVKLSSKKDEKISEGVVLEAYGGDAKVDCTIRGILEKDKDWIRNWLDEKMFKESELT